jgi:hypothetical protein
MSGACYKQKIQSAKEEPKHITPYTLNIHTHRNKDCTAPQQRTANPGLLHSNIHIHIGKTEGREHGEPNTLTVALPTATLPTHKYKQYQKYECTPQNMSHYIHNLYVYILHICIKIQTGYFTFYNTN